MCSVSKMFRWFRLISKFRNRNTLLVRKVFIATLIIFMFFLVIIGMQQYPLHTAFEISINDTGSFRSKLFPNACTDFPFVYEMTLPIEQKKFTNEESRLIGFALKTSNFTNDGQTRGNKMIYLATEYFGEWNPSHFYFLHLGQKTFKRYSCPLSDCYATNDPKDIPKADAVLFHVRDLEIHKFPKFRSPKQVYIIYSMEPSWLELIDFKRFNGIFNWTMSYRNGSDVLVQYGFIGCRRETNTSSRQMLVVSQKMFDAKEDKAVWYSSNCCTDSGREKYVAQLKKYFPVDVLGGCGIEGCRPAETNKCYKKIAERYKFYLSFENAICNSYVTEKLYNVMEHKIIPVVLGGANYKSLTPPESVINALDFLGPKELADFLWLVSSNYSLYSSYFQWKSTYRAYLQPWMCDLCEKLNKEPINAPARNDLVQWWSDDNSCQRWTGKKVEQIRSSVFPCYHTRIFQ